MRQPGARPLITFALISYHDERYIREAVEGALAQTYRPLEIILSNDCSADRTFEIMKNMAARYRGPHRLVLNRNKQNQGTGGHINKIMELSRGEIVVIAAGDDISYPERTARLYEVIRKGGGRIKSVYSNAVLIDETGAAGGKHFTGSPLRDEFLLANLVHRYEFGIVAGCSHAWTRDLFEQFGPLQTPLSVEDSPIAFRAALLGEIAYTDEMLIKHRRHGNNTWQYKIKDPLRDIRYQAFEKDAVLRNWARDVRIAQLLMPERGKELGIYHECLKARIASAAEDVNLFKSTWTKRSAHIAQRILKGMPLRTARHKIGVFLLPQVYQCYMLMKYRLRDARSARQGASSEKPRKESLI